MKNFLLLFLCLMLSVTIYGQNLEQVKIQNVEGLEEKQMIPLKNNKIYCFFTPLKTDIIGDKYAMGVYNSSFTYYKQISNIPEVSVLFDVIGFHNFLCFSNGQIKGNPLLSRSSDNQLIILDTSFKVVKKINYPLSNDKSEFASLPNFFLNHDSSSLILENVIDPSPGKPSLKTNVLDYQVSVYDKKLEPIFSAYLDFDKIFGKGKEINQYKYEYINNCLYIIAKTNYNSILKNSHHFYIAKIENNGISKIIHHETFESGYFTFCHIVLNRSDLLVSGLLSDRKKTFYQFTYKTNDNQSVPKVAKHLFADIDKKINSKYSNFNLHGIASISIVPAQYGYYLISDAQYTSNSTMLLRNVSVMLVDYNGEIKWYNTIPRVFEFGGAYSGEDYNSKGFVKSNNLYLIYHDFDKNVLSHPDGFGDKVTSHGLPCLTLSIITPEQEITSQILDLQKNKKIFWLPNTLFKVNNNYYLYGSPIYGYPRGAIHTNNYLSIFNLI